MWKGNTMNTDTTTKKNIKFVVPKNRAEYLNQMFCTSRAGLSQCQNLAGNEIILIHGKEDPLFPIQRHSMGKKIENLQDRRQWEKDFAILAQPYFDTPADVPQFFCQVALEHTGPAWQFYFTANQKIQAITRWAQKTNSLLVCTTHYTESEQEPCFLIASIYQNSDSQMDNASYRQSFYQAMTGESLC